MKAITQTPPCGEMKSKQGNLRRSDDMLRRLPDHVLITKVFTYFNFTDYALTSYI